MKILITDGNSRASLAITRSLGRAGHELFIGEAFEPNLSSCSRFCSRSLCYPSPEENPGEFAQYLLRFIRRERIEVLLLPTDVSLFSVLPMDAQFREICHLPIPKSENLYLSADKAWVFKEAKRLGVPIPRTWYAEKTKSVISSDLSSTLVFPVVIKPSRSRVIADGHWRMCSVGYAADMDQLVSDLESRFPEEFPVLLQERIAGPGMGIYSLFDRGKPLTFFAHRRLREKPPSGGVSVFRESIPVDPRLREYTEKLLQSLDWHGVAMVEFKQDISDHIPKLMEINGRFWGSLQLAIDAGVDFPKLLIQLASDPRPEPVLSYRTGVKTRWLWGDVDHLLLRLFKRDRDLNLTPDHPGRLKTLFDFIKFWGGNLNFEILSLRDLRPWIQETCDRLSNRRKNRRKDWISGLIHVHTNYSKDSQITLDELEDFCRKNCIRFLAITDHAEDVSPEKWRELVQLCKERSFSDLLLIPGLEISLNPRQHILAIGIQSIPCGNRMDELIQKIREQGGLAVLAHPCRFGNTNAVVPSGGVPDAIEIWNVTYDSRYLPSDKALRLYRKMRINDSKLLALAGMELHSLPHADKKLVRVRINHSLPLKVESILAALRKGQYMLCGKGFRIAGLPVLHSYHMVLLGVLRRILNLADYFISFLRWEKSSA